jgi:hypothetical protein
MHASRRSLALLAALGGLACAPAAHAAADHTINLSADKLTDSVTGATTMGFNTSWLAYETSNKAPAPSCKAGSPDTQCETTLIHVTATNVGSGTLTLRLDGFQQYSDFDLKSFDSDATGTMIKNLGSPVSDNSKSSPLGSLDPRNTSAGDFETKTIALGGYVNEVGDLDAYFLAAIPYFMVANDSYKLTATVSDLAPPEPEEE